MMQHFPDAFPTFFETFFSLTFGSVLAFRVKFAHDHNLRLVVKNTGHDWYGRSTAAGSLLLWTHLRKNITFHDGFVAEGCDASTAVDAVRVGSGVQFADLYPAALMKDKIVMGGTCDSVGVAGCWTAGCYGPFTKRFVSTHAIHQLLVISGNVLRACLWLQGNGAINILEAKVVLADGSLVTASKCSHPDLFMSIRGGAGGLAGVVTEFTAKSHRAPEWVANAGFSGSAGTLKECEALFAEVMKMNAKTAMNNSAGELCDNGGLNWGCGENGK
jgi:FAD/FMN-containing dehydrogenase